MRILLLLDFFPGLSLITAALSPMTIKGSKLFNENGTQLYIKGMYAVLFNCSKMSRTSRVEITRQFSSKILGSKGQCKIDAALMQKLGVNFVKVEHSADTDLSACMSIYDQAGIYVWASLQGVGEHLDYSPLHRNSVPWRSVDFDRMKLVIDEFSKYNNTAGFTLGEENQEAGVDKSYTSPFFKAAIRDVKVYIKSKSYRNIPVGLADSFYDNSPQLLRDYLTCSTTSAENADFFALHYDGHCSNDNIDSDISYVLEAFASSWASTAVPVLLLIPEISCPRRSIPQQEAILDPQRAGRVLSGSFMAWGKNYNSFDNSSLIGYENVVGHANGSIFLASPNDIETPVAIEPRFSSLQAAWGKQISSGTSLSLYSLYSTTPHCPKFDRGTWELDGSVSLPVLDQVLDDSLRQKWSGNKRDYGTNSSDSSRSAASGIDTRVGSSMLVLFGSLVILYIL